MSKLATIFRESRTARFLIPLGITVLIFGIFMFVVNSKNQNYIETQAVVTNVTLYEEAYYDANENYIEATYDVSLKYSVDGKEYEGQFTGISKYNVGDKIKIYYNPSNPIQITQTKSLILPAVIIFAGIGLLAAGIVNIVNVVKKQKQMKIQEEGWKKA